jgi:hypothetical protein
VKRETSWQRNFSQQNSVFAGGVVGKGEAFERIELIQAGEKGVISGRQIFRERQDDGIDNGFAGLPMTGRIGAVERLAVSLDNDGPIVVTEMEEGGIVCGRGDERLPEKGQPQF